MVVTVSCIKWSNVYVKDGLRWLSKMSEYGCLKQSIPIVKESCQRYFKNLLVYTVSKSLKIWSRFPGVDGGVGMVSSHILINSIYSKYLLEVVTICEV